MKKKIKLKRDVLFTHRPSLRHRQPPAHDSLLPHPVRRHSSLPRAVSTGLQLARSRLRHQRRDVRERVRRLVGARHRRLPGRLRRRRPRRRAAEAPVWRRRQLSRPGEAVLRRCHAARGLLSALRWRREAVLLEEAGELEGK